MDGWPEEELQLGHQLLRTPGGRGVMGTTHACTRRLRPARERTMTPTASPYTISALVAPSELRVATSQCCWCRSWLGPQAEMLWGREGGTRLLGW